MIIARESLFHETTFLIIMILGQFFITGQSLAISIDVTTTEGVQASTAYTLGNLRYDDHDYENAVRYFQQAISHVPNFPEAYIKMAMAYYALNDFRSGDIAYASAQQIDPQMAEKVKSIIMMMKGIMSVPVESQVLSNEESPPHSTENTLPSFDCDKATKPDELVICSNNDLAELDNLVAAGYGYLAQTRGAKTAKPIGLRLWRMRQVCGADAACIRERQIAAIRTYQDYGAPIELPTWSE